MHTYITRFLIVGGTTANPEIEDFGYLYSLLEYDASLGTNGNWTKRPERLRNARETFAAFLVPDSYPNCTVLQETD